MAFIPAEKIQPIGICREYGDLIAALDRQRQRKGFTMLALDERAGFYEGYSGHIFSHESKTGRMLGPISYPLVLEALGLALAVVEIDPPKAERSAPSADQLELPLPTPERARLTIERLKARRRPPAENTKAKAA